MGKTNSIACENIRPRWTWWQCSRRIWDWKLEITYPNIRKFSEEGVLSEEIADLFRRFGDLRNAIACHYNHFDIRKV